MGWTAWRVTTSGQSDTLGKAGITARLSSTGTDPVAGGNESERHHHWRQYADERGCPEQHERMGSRYLPRGHLPQEPHTAVERYLLDDRFEPQPGHFGQLVAWCGSRRSKRHLGGRLEEQRRW